MQPRGARDRRGALATLLAACSRRRISAGLYGLVYASCPLKGEDRELRKSEDTVTDERAGVFTPDKNRCTADGTGRAAVD